MFGPKIIGKIELPERKIRPEEYRELLENKLAGASREVNEEFGNELLDDKGSILMAEHSELEADKKFVAELENNWAREQYKTADEWRQSKEKNPATITEMAVTLALQRLLKNRFIVARASAFDDYKYGVDNVLIDKETGAAVCGFDEVLGFTGDDGRAKKDKKIKNSLAHGGSSLKYGATIESGQIKRQELNNIPTFYLSLSKEELGELLKDLKNNSEPTANEKSLVIKMLVSLDKQYDEAGEVAVGQALKDNLNKFAASLEVIKQQVNKN